MPFVIIVDGRTDSGNARRARPGRRPGLLVLAGSLVGAGRVYLAHQDRSRLIAECAKIEELKDLVYLMSRTDSGLDG
jgi:hypothetical protein